MQNLEGSLSFLEASAKGLLQILWIDKHFNRENMFSKPASKRYLRAWKHLREVASQTYLKCTGIANQFSELKYCLELYSPI